MQESGVAGGTDRGYGDDVAEGGDPAGVAAAGVEGAAASGGDIEQGTAVDVVRQETRCWRWVTHATATSPARVNRRCH